MKKKQPLVSIIVTSFNYGSYITKTLESLINQTYKNIEIIVVDDGSKDNSIDIIKNYEKIDSRIKLYVHDNNENRGLDKSVKLGIQKANGEWIAFCESDDYLELNYIEEKINYYNKYKNVNVIVNHPNMFGNQELIEFKKNEFQPLYKVLRSIQKPKNIYIDLMQKGNNMVFSTFSIVMVQSEKLKKCNLNPPVIPTAIDIWLWKQLLLHCKIGYIDLNLTNWRLHHKSVTQTSKEKNWDEYFKELNKILIWPINIRLEYIRKKFLNYEIDKSKYKIIIFGIKFTRKIKNAKR